jgi:hypothetical protein
MYYMQDHSCVCFWVPLSLSSFMWTKPHRHIHRTDNVCIFIADSYTMTPWGMATLDSVRLACVNLTSLSQLYFSTNCCLNLRHFHIAGKKTNYSLMIGRKMWFLVSLCCTGPVVCLVWLCASSLHSTPFIHYNYFAHLPLF